VFEVTPKGETVWNYRSVPRHSLFRAERYPLDHPGVVALLAAKAQASASGD
jgi:hypothetical protein